MSSLRDFCSGCFGWTNRSGLGNRRTALGSGHRSEFRQRAPVADTNGTSLSSLRSVSPPATDRRWQPALYLIAVLFARRAITPLVSKENREQIMRLAIATLPTLQKQRRPPIVLMTL